MLHKSDDYVAYVKSFIVILNIFLKSTSAIIDYLTPKPSIIY